MRKIVNWGLSLSLILAFATPGLAQKITDPAEYTAYMGAFNEKDLSKKGPLAEKFLADYPKTDARNQAYMMMILSYGQTQNWAKTLEAADRQAKDAPNLPASDKNQISEIGMLAASQLKNTAKVAEYAEKVLAVQPNHFPALISLWETVVSKQPMDPTRTLEVTRRALGIKTKPQGYADAQWNAIQVQLHRTVCLVMVNQQKYQDSIPECRAALSINSKDGDSWYLIGLALKPELIEAVRQYEASNKEYNDNRTAGPIVVDELMAKMKGLENIASEKNKEVLDAFARAVAFGGAYATQARSELQKMFTGTPEELNQLIADKKNLGD
jgi:tetratricopeptide (TPR) repeat protein